MRVERARLISYGVQVLADARQYGEAEALLLKAKRPEVALKMYREARLWDDAIRVAEDYVPGRAQELRLEAAASLQDVGASAGFGGSGVEAQVQRAKLLERAGDHGGAVDAYLAVTRDMTDDTAVLEQARAPRGPPNLTKRGALPCRSSCCHRVCPSTRVMTRVHPFNPGEPPQPGRARARGVPASAAR